MESGKCRLCGAEGPLCRSHILPKFVSDWQKRTSLTGRFRTTQAPNRRTEDGLWRYMLCQTCEQRFSSAESAVCQRIFLPLHDHGASLFRTGPEFLKFAVSVSWRVLIFLTDGKHLGGLETLSDDVSGAEATWREYLLDRRRNPGRYVAYGVPLDAVASGTAIEGASSTLNRFILRSFAFSPYGYDGAGYLIIKLCRMLLVAVIVDKYRSEWRNVKLHADGGAWGARDLRMPGFVLSYLRRGADQVDNLPVSDKQEAVTAAAVQRAIDTDVTKAAASGTFTAFEHDLRLFGKAAFAPEEDK